MGNNAKQRKFAAMEVMAELSDYEADANVSDAEIVRLCKEVRRSVAERRHHITATDDDHPDYLV